MTSITGETLLSDYISSYIGISSSTLMLVLCLSTVVVFSLLVFLKTYSMTSTIIIFNIGILILWCIGIVPIWICFIEWFFLIIYIGCRCFLLTSGLENTNKKEKSINCRAKKELTIKLTIESEKYKEYFNNLDKLLNIKTKICNDLYTNENAIVLHNNNELSISDSFNWFITDKHPELNMFKVVGLHKKDVGKNRAIIIGSKNNTPFMYDLEDVYITSETYQGKKWYEIDNVGGYKLNV